MIKIKLFATGLLIFAIGCSSTDKKVEEPVNTPIVEAPPKVEIPVKAEEPPKKVEAPVVASRSVDTGATIDAQNQKLAKAPVEGLPAFGSGKKNPAIANDSLDIAKAAIAEMPEGYVLQITGHHNQHPDKAKRKGNALSVQRAKQVYDYFVKNGIAKEKLTYRGVGSSAYDKELSRAKNRRVTFKIVKAGAPAEENP